VPAAAQRLEPQAGVVRVVAAARAVQRVQLVAAPPARSSASS
jgi:hypothetical protein